MTTYTVKVVFRHTKSVTWAVIGFSGGIIGLVLLMAFWGTDAQQDMARDLVGYVLSLASGLGFGYFLGRRRTG